MNPSHQYSNNAIIVSDLHIGSRYFLYQEFGRFLANIPEDHELILNGDVIDNPYSELNVTAPADLRYYCADLPPPESRLGQR